MLGNLKQFQEATPADHPDLQKLQAVFPYNNTICAASTHKDEDQIILDAFKLAKQINPALKLILVPRHAKRSQDIESLLILSSFSYSVRSNAQIPTETDDIYLADTMGEMPLWYSSAAVTFVAGSLVPVGGHTPFEPAAFGSAITHGSQYSNFQAIYEQLVAAKGSLQADTPKDIAAAWVYLQDTRHRDDYLKAAKKSLFENSDKDRILNEIVRKIGSFL
jgi:3-deoxy-D-manno-octulosonic-acid transferase